MNGSIREFTDLIAWQKAHQFVLDTYQTVGKFPREETYGLVSQMRRAAVSITSNIAEGFGRVGRREKIQFYLISQASASELQNQFILSKDLGYIDQDIFNRLWNQSLEVRRLLHGLIKSIRDVSPLP